MNKEQLAQEAKQYFETHPTVDVFHATEDGMFFIERNHAVNHARSINGPVHAIVRTIEAPKAPELTEEEKLELMKEQYAKAVAQAQQAIEAKDADQVLAFYQQATKANWIGEVNDELTQIYNAYQELDKQEFESLKLEFEQLFGKKPAANIKKATLKKQVQDKKTNNA
jgi:hypothetical protein